MTPESQRIAIAEACGWKWVWIPKSPDGFHDRPMLWGPDWPDYGHPKADIPEEITYDDIDHLPDYLNDLNAMHEAEKVLTERQREVYADVLSGIVINPDFSVHVPGANEYIGYIEHPAEDTFEIYHATSAQRAEAFLRTLGLWKDTP